MLALSLLYSSNYRGWSCWLDRTMLGAVVVAQSVYISCGGVHLGLAIKTSLHLESSQRLL
jgi:hypothetical protein